MDLLKRTTKLIVLFVCLILLTGASYDNFEDLHQSCDEEYGMSYCQMWCMASSSGVLFLIGNLFNSIDEFNAGYNIS